MTEHPPEVIEVLGWLIEQGGRAIITDVPPHLHEALHEARSRNPPFVATNIGDIAIRPAYKSRKTSAIGCCGAAALYDLQIRALGPNLPAGFRLHDVTRQAS